MATFAFSGWLIAYLLPVLLMLSIIGLSPHRPGTTFRMLTVHGALCLSVLISQYLLYSTGDPFPWNIHPLSVLFFITTIAIVPVLLGRFGFFYTLSALIQELVLTSVFYYLSDLLNFWLIVLLIVPIYAASHLLEPKHWQIKIPATLVWGTVSLALFALYGDVLLNTVSHAILGSIFIYSDIMYPRSDFAIKRKNTTTYDVLNTK